MSDVFSGGCLCGNARYTCSATPQVAVHCHCEDCRKSSGTGHCTHLMVQNDAFTISGPLSSFSKQVDSGNQVDRFFCPNCGSALYSINSGMAGVVFPRASSLDDPEIAAPQMTVYASRAASWDPIATDLPSCPEMPPSNPAE
ncbi:aldehyde-activating protein [Rhodobacterales bacterium 56_14_T64]|nr:aldehyde-activating protein [Rhodobacterales bacterium 56_14_T64]